MCGIVGYIGDKQAYPFLIKGLHRLEYRGYDSAGIAMISSEKELNIYRCKGKVSDLVKHCDGKNLDGDVGIAHTRWATHGEPNENNAHPQCSQSEKFAIVHNGIIENYATLRRKLQQKGVTFRSDTDTEVIVQLIEYIKTRKDNIDTLHALQIALHEIIGAYAIALLDKDNPEQLIIAKKQSPLVVGIGDNEYFVSSDANPLAEYTSRVFYLEDDSIAVLRKGEEIKVVNILDQELTPNICTVNINLGQLDKEGYAHYMLKEIFEQPECLENCMRGRINKGGNIKKKDIVLNAVIDHKAQLLGAKRFIIVACGTSWHAGLIGKQLIESFCRIPVEVEYASEFRYRCPVIEQGDVVIAISQSGETADTLAAIKLARKVGAFVFGICNAVGSSIPRSTDTGTYIHVGPEIGVASTKAFTGQVTVLIMLALALAQKKGTINQKDFVAIIEELCNIPDKIREVLLLDERLKVLSRIFTYARNFLYLGRGYNYPVALEGALKLKEISYVHAEGYPAAEMKHGPIALIDFDMPVVVIATHNTMYEKVLSNIQEIKSRKGKIIAIVTKGDTTISNIVDEVIEIPSTLDCLEPLLSVIPLQLLAYHIAVCRGKDVDQPRNLAKSVTVE